MESPFKTKSPLYPTATSDTVWVINNPDNVNYEVIIFGSEKSLDRYLSNCYDALIEYMDNNGNNIPDEYESLYDYMEEYDSNKVRKKLDFTYFCTYMDNMFIIERLVH